MKRRTWIAFWVVRSTCGSSILWTKLGHRDLEPLTLYVPPLSYGALGLDAPMRRPNQFFARRPQQFLTFLCMAVVNTVLLFALFRGISGIPSRIPLSDRSLCARCGCPG